MPYVITNADSLTAAFPIDDIKQAQTIINAAALYTEEHAKAGITGFTLEYENSLRFTYSEYDASPDGTKACELPSVLGADEHAGTTAAIDDALEVSVWSVLSVTNNAMFVRVFDTDSGDDVEFEFPIQDIRTAYGHLLWDEEKPSLLVDEGRGLYIPQAFINRYVGWEGISDENRDILRAGPEHPEYMEAWDEVLENATWIDGQGIKFRLEQDGDLWAVPVDAINPNESE